MPRLRSKSMRLGFLGIVIILSTASLSSCQQTQQSQALIHKVLPAAQAVAPLKDSGLHAHLNVPQ